MSALSWSNAAQKFGIPGFPAKEHKLDKKLETEESLYSELRNLYDKGGSESTSALYGNKDGGLYGVAESTQVIAWKFFMEAELPYKHPLYIRMSVCHKILWPQFLLNGWMD